MNHLFEARDLMREYSEETKGFDVFQVCQIWEAYSDTMAAGWMTPDEESVKQTFDYFRTTEV